MALGQFTNININLNQKDSRWKLYLGIAGVVIMALSMMYVNFSGQNLEATERASVEIYVNAQVAIAKTENDKDKDVTFELQALETNKIPIIVTDEKTMSPLEVIMD